MDKSRNTRKGKEGGVGGEKKEMNETSFELLDTALPKDIAVCDFSVTWVKESSFLHKLIWVVFIVPFT